MKSSAVSVPSTPRCARRERVLAGFRVGYRGGPPPTHAVIALLLTVVFSIGTGPPGAWALTSRSLLEPKGAVTNDQLGLSVASAGDVNGDGYDDVIVGAPNNDAAGTDAGQAYLYFGGPGADDIPDLIMTGNNAGDLFGFSVSGAGDVNGDGYDDVLVGAIGYDSPGVSAGRVYLFHGGSPPSNLGYLQFSAAAAGDGFGYSVARAGDINGDGYADIIVGAPFNDAGGTDAGRAYVYFGGNNDANADITFTDAAAGDRFGWSVSGAGDVNADRFSDVIVGGFLNGGGNGRAYVYFGGQGADNTADLILVGSAAERLGNAVSSAGDVNGDGYSDLIVGAYTNSVAGTNAGRAYVYYGGVAPDATADVTLTGVAGGDFFGYSVSGAGDVNGDGYADVIVGANGVNTIFTDTGRAYVYLGGGSPDASADIVFTGKAANDFHGAFVSSAGDVNGDGFSDVIVGAYGCDTTNGTDTGRAYVYLIYPYEILSPNGGEELVIGSRATVKWRGRELADIAISTDGGATYNTVLSGAGGLVDNEVGVVVPGPATNLALVRVSQTGQTVRHSTSDASDATFSIAARYNPPAIVHRAGPTFTGAAAEFLGGSVSGAGDVNGDGYGDVIIGAPYNDAGGVDAGRAYVYHGGPGADAVPDLTLTGAATNDGFGFRVAGAGDVNGDGYADVIVATYAGLGNAGKVYLYYGSSAPNAVADLTLTGVFNDDFGVSISAADVNGDGYSDIIVGAPSPNTTPGKVLVYYGGLAPDAVADLMFTGEAAGDGFGASVSAAGDANGDGFSDVIVGASGNDAGGNLAGRAYVFFGGASPDLSPDMVLTGRTGDDFGRVVSSAGDVNDDGFSDVVVGAPFASTGPGSRGIAYVYYGGRTANTVPDLLLIGEKSNEFFANSVSGAGDVNGDGYSDILVGAGANDGTGTDAGKAYLYFGGPAVDDAVDVTFSGVAAGDQFGVALSSAGDFNGDGYSDVVIAAPYANGGVGTGAAYIHTFCRYLLLSPNGGETWNVGATKTISWLGAEPADVWLSTDGGSTQQLVETRVGGSETNTLSLRVPHTPTKFARIKLTPADLAITGLDRSDSLFTIQTSVALLSLLAAPMPQGGATVTWSTDPGPADLSGYRLERAAAGGSDWRPVVALTRETAVTDPEGGPGTQYRLYAVNGFGDELMLGEASLKPLVSLSAWPLPYRGGALTISFASAGALGAGGARTEVAIYDVRGRLVRRVADRAYPQGYHTVGWDGRDSRGREVGSGIYFLTSMSGGEQRSFRLTVLR